MSSSMPEDVQYEMIHTVPGLEHAEIVRNAYAIEYDCINPRQLKPSLEFKDIPGFFSAGQANGSSGYEEAAAQGLIAGINAAKSVKGEEPLILDRSQAVSYTHLDVYKRQIQQWAINKHMEGISVEDIIKENIEKQNKKRAKKGLPPLNEKANINACLLYTSIETDHDILAGMTHQDILAHGTDHGI